MKRLLVSATCSLLLLAIFGCGGQSGNQPADDPASTSQTAPTADGASANPVAGVSRGTLTDDGLRRTYRLFVPSGLDASSSVPLVVGLHGGLGSGEQFAENSQFEALAEQEKFVAVFPDGVDRTWNGGNCCGGAVRKGIDDVGFLAALIEELAAELPVDRSRVLMTGHSNGGIMAFRFGCERPELVKAIAPVAGSLEMPACESSGATHLFAIHGDADQSHPLEGGQGPRSIAGVDFVSMAESMELWAAAKECEALGVSGPGLVLTHAWDCRDGALARLLVIAGADHPWPGGVGGRPAAQGRTSEALNATRVIWEFFETVR